MTDLSWIEEARAVCEAATEGPWHDAAINKDGCGGWDLPKDRTLPKAPTGSLIQSAVHTMSEAVVMPSNYDNSPWCLPEDRAFIALARTALPRALDELEKADRRNGQLGSAIRVARGRLLDCKERAEQAEARVQELEAIMEEMGDEIDGLHEQLEDSTAP